MMARMGGNRYRELLRGGGLALGVFNFIASEEIVDLAGYAGLDFVIFDTEHASYGIDYIERGVRATEAHGLVSVCRMSHADPYLIQRVLNTGVDGLLFARVESRGEVEDIMRSCKLAPLGDRGACPGSRSGKYRLMPADEYTRTANDVSVCIFIETIKGVENAEEILSVPGIDGVAVGKSDLAQDMAVEIVGEAHHPKTVEAEEQVYAIARKLGLGAMAGLRELGQLASYLEREHHPNVFFFGTDARQLGGRFRDLVKGSRSLAEQSATR